MGAGGGAKGLKEGAVRQAAGRADRAVQGTRLAKERRSQQGAYFL